MFRKGLILLLAALTALSVGWSAAEEEIAVPEVTVREYEIPDNEALRMIRDMKAGWNLGNTFDAIDCTWLTNKLDYESGWCGVKTPEALIEALKEAGFKTIRIPVSWHNHVDADFRIDEAWMARVEEVVSWAYDRDMYVILNIHHDCDKNYYYPDSAHLENSTAYMKAIWSQVAERFASRGDRLIFESINEPRLKGNEKYEWYWTSVIPECRDAMKCIVALNQVFVDTVRASGGENANRYLMVPSYDASPYYAYETTFTLPKDTAENRIIVSAHAYTPYSFALEMPGVSTFSLTGSQPRDIDDFMDKLYRKFVSRGIPVLIGEYGALAKGGNMQDRVNFTAYYVASARARGMTACWWDNHAFSGSGENFGLIDRKTQQWKAPKILEAIMRYCGE